MLQRNKIPWRAVSSVVAVGGGARIPMISARLAEHLAAHGAVGALVTTRSPRWMPRWVQPCSRYTAPTPTPRPGWRRPHCPAGLRRPLLSTAARPPRPLPSSPTLTCPRHRGRPRGEGHRAVAGLVEDSDGGGDLLPYTGDDAFGDTTATRAIAQYVAPAGPVVAEPSKAWQRLPLIVFGVATLAAIAAVGGVTIALTGDRKPVAPPTTPPPSVNESPTPPPRPVEPPPPSTVTVTNEVPAPPPPQPSPTYQPRSRTRRRRRTPPRRTPRRRLRSRRRPPPHPPRPRPRHRHRHRRRRRRPPRPRRP